MEKRQGFKYVVDVKGNVEEFAKVILQLVNLKSSVPDSILHVKTLDGTNLIQVVTYKDSKEFLAEFGEVTMAEETEVQTITFNDLKPSIQAQIEKQDDDMFDYFIQIEDWQE